MIRIVLVIVFALITIIIAVYAYYGGFRKVQFTFNEQGGETLAYHEAIGDYKQSGEIMNKVYSLLLNDYKIETYKGFGIYYDNPQKIDKNKLHSDIGCIIEDEDVSKVNVLENSLKIKIYPKNNYLVTEFPYNGKISVIIGVMKVYPEMNKYLKENNLSEQGAVMEIYDIPNKRIIYRKEI